MKIYILITAATLLVASIAVGQNIAAPGSHDDTVAGTKAHRHHEMPGHEMMMSSSMPDRLQRYYGGDLAYGFQFFFRIRPSRH